jgi:ferric-dicitrate binding protein FerR (iron transport regulator)
MSREHILPDRWAELRAGGLDAVETARIEAHTADCGRCQKTRERVFAATGAMEELRQAQAPELNWDLLGARLSWVVSSELRRHEREQEHRRGWARRLFPVALGGAVFAAALAAVLFLSKGGITPKREVASVPRAVAVPVSPAPAIVPTPTVSLEGVITMLQGEVTLDGSPATLDSSIRSRSTLQTGEGTVAVQFGDKSGFLVERRSSVIVRTFDEGEVSLEVSGAVAMDVTKRRPDQRLQIVAGTRTVEVRGTVFRVENRNEALDVIVTRGRVAVLEGGDSVEVPAAERLSLAAGAPLGSVRPRRMLDAEAADMTDRVRIPFVPAWASAAQARAASLPMQVVAAPRARVRVDGEDVAAGSFLLRAMPGRHLVQLGAMSRWVAVEEGQSNEASLLPEVLPGRERPAQVRAELAAHRQEFVVCGQKARKRDPFFSGKLTVEITINNDGSIDSIVPLVGVQDRDTEQCVLHVIDGLTFPAGGKGTVRQQIEF